MEIRVLSGCDRFRRLLRCFQRGWVGGRFVCCCPPAGGKRRFWKKKKEGSCCYTHERRSMASASEISKGLLLRRQGIGECLPRSRLGTNRTCHYAKKGVAFCWQNAREIIATAARARSPEKYAPWANNNDSSPLLVSPDEKYPPRSMKRRTNFRSRCYVFEKVESDISGL